jgi:hypothetical protein
MLKITIITNTIRRPIELVEKSVRSSLSQNESVSVILMDQNQHVLKFSLEVQSNPRFKHMHCQVPSVSMARNRADYAVDTDWIVFCDDDGYLVEGYIKKLLLLIDEFPEVEVFSGGIKRIDNGEFYSKRHAIGGDMKWFWNAKLLMGSNFVIKKEVFEELGKFDELFGAGAPYGSSEETDLAWNAFFHQKKMRYSPELIVNHVPPFASDLNAEIKKSFRYGVGKGALVRKWIFKGEIKVFFELFEMLILPLLRAPIFVLTLKFKEMFILFSAFFGRLKGLFS